MNNKIALAGVPNCGKTTFWNLSTGKSGKTGNWPGVTLKKLSAPLLLFPNTELIDLPGIYSLSGKNPEETVAEKYLKSGNADSLIILIDGTNPEPGLYLALELLALGIPTVIGINFSDELKKNNITADTKKLSELLNVPVFLISAYKKENTNQLISAAKNAVSKRASNNLPSKERHTKAFEFASACFAQKTDTHTKKASLLVLFFFCMLTAFLIRVVPVLKSFLDFFFEHFTAIVSAFFNYLSLPAMLRSLFSEGIVPGISAVLSFVPELSAIFLSLAFLESSGYMSRAAFASDYLLKKIGLSGRSAIPMLIGLGCTVPAVYAAKSSENEQAGKRTLSSLMFIPCSARLPLVFLICESIFPVLGKQTFLFFFLAVLALGALFSFLTNRSLSPEFVLELPKIRIPSIKSVIKTAWLRVGLFLRKASGTVMLTAVLIWALKNYSFHFEHVELFSESALFSIGSFVFPFFRPTGIPLEGVIALFCGLFSKESSLFSLVLLSPLPDKIFSPFSAISFLLFYLIYSPCAAALISIKNEFGIKKAVWLFVRQTVLAYFISFSFYQFALLIKNIFIP